MANIGTENKSVIFEQDVYISTLKRERTTRILLPPAYYKYPSKRFPVLYMLDGQNLFSTKTAFGRPWHIQKTMDNLPLKFQCIVVGIDNGGTLRSSEYLPHHHHKHMHHGEGGVFLDFIAHELKPKVDQHLRTLTERDHTMIAGSSLGGLLSFYAATRKCDIFGKAGVFSPSFWLYPQIFHWNQRCLSKIYVSGSKTESRGMARSLEKTYHELKNAGFPDDKIRVVIKDRGKHNEVLWGQQFGPMLRWLME
jgi:predicted alpha/beta superfamily hydrolase